MTAELTIASGSFDRLPPHDIESEQCLLASIIIDPTIITDIGGIVSRDSFFQTDHQIIFEALLAMQKSGVAIDLVTLRADLLRRQVWEEVGGEKYVTQFFDMLPSAGHYRHYANVVREKFLLRQLIAASNDILRDAYAAHESADAVLAKSTKRLTDIASGQNTSDVVKFGEQAQQVYATIETRSVQLIPTGYHAIDLKIGGLGMGESFVVAGFPSMGKSTVGRQLIYRIGRAGIPCAIISCEEDRDKLTRNILSSVVSIDNNLIRRGQLNADDYKNLIRGVAKVANYPIWFADKAYSIEAVRAVAARLVARHGVKVIVFDYLQRFRADGKTEYERTTNASQELSRLIKELGIAGVVLSQLNREAQKRPDHRPIMSDLRGSGQIEQDADGIWLLHREDYYHLSDTDYVPTQELEINIAKMRDGERGGPPVILKSELRYQRFDDKEFDLIVD